MPKSMIYTLNVEGIKGESFVIIKSNEGNIVFLDENGEQYEGEITAFCLSRELAIKMLKLLVETTFKK